MTATVRRSALRLVRLETEQEALFTTPEHPFATPGSGWIQAERLASGDRVLSERFGAVRLLSVRSLPAPRPVPVFNLSVSTSHAYFVGTDRLLVHNTKCQPNPSESRETDFEQALRQRKELTLQLRTLTRKTPASPRIAELKLQRNELNRQITKLRLALRKEQGVAASPRAEVSRQFHEAALETERKALEEAQKELAELERRPPNSEADEATLAARQAKLEKQITALTLSTNRTNQILDWMRELAELDRSTPTTDEDRQALEKKKEELRTSLNQARKRARTLKSARTRRADPEGRAEAAQYNRNLKHRLLQFPAHLADTERPRDPLERRESELAHWLQEAPSETRDAHIHHLTDQIETMKRLVVVRREHQRLREMRRRVRRGREKQIARGEDTRKLDTKLENSNPPFHTIRVELAQLRIRERLLAGLSETPWANAPGPVDAVKLREFERQLAANLTPNAQNEQQLSSIERALDIMAPSHADSQDAVPNETRAADEARSEHGEVTRQPSSPERGAGLQSSYERLQQELHKGRAAVEVALSALANEHAYLHTTQAGSSSGPTWQDRLRAIQEEQEALRAHWRVRLLTRLDTARQELELLRSIDRLRDEAVEAELALEIALIERELHSFGG